MSRQEVEVLLSAPEIAVLATADANGRPEASPVWFDYDGVVVRVLIHRNSRKARNVRANPYVSITVDTRTPPYRGVILRGQASLSGPDPGLRRRLAHRYLEEETAERYLQATTPFDQEDVLMTIHVESSFSWDYAKGL